MREATIIIIIIIIIDAQQLFQIMGIRGLEKRSGHLSRHNPNNYPSSVLPSFIPSPRSSFVNHALNCSLRSWRPHPACHWGSGSFQQVS